jgi:hypothetical protein
MKRQYTAGVKTSVTLAAASGNSPRLTSIAPERGQRELWLSSTLQAVIGEQGGILYD